MTVSHPRSSIDRMPTCRPMFVGRCRKPRLHRTHAHIQPAGLTHPGIREEIKKVMKQPGYDDGSAGPVFVRYVRAGTLTPPEDIRHGNTDRLRTDLRGMPRETSAWWR